MRSTLLTLYLFLSASVVAQRADFTVEVPVTRPELGAIALSSWPIIATDGDTFLTVWTDHREPYRYITYAARFTSDGTLLDRVPLRLKDGIAGDVIWTGRAYLVAVQSLGTWTLLTLDADARVISERTISTSRLGYESAFATNGENVLLIGNASGVLLDLEGRSIRSFGTQYGDFIDVASNGRDYLIVSHNLSNVQATPVTHAGGVRGTRTLVASDAGWYDVAVESSGDDYLIVWTGKGVFGRVVDSSGAPTAPRTTLYAAAPDVTTTAPGVVRDGDELIVTYTVGSVSHELRTTGTGEPLEEPRAFADGSHGVLAVAGSTKGYAWTNGGVHGRVSRGRRSGDALLLSRGIRPQRSPQITHTGSNPIAVWVEGGEIRIARLGGTSQVVASFRRDLFELQTEVVFDGRFVWVVWRALHFQTRRYTPDLVPVDETPLEIPGPQCCPGQWSVAAGTNGIVIAATYVEADAAPAMEEADIGPRPAPSIVWAAVARTSGDAVIVSNVTLADNIERDVAHPTAAWNGHRYVVAWVDSRAEEPSLEVPPRDIVAARLTTDGVVVDPVPIVVASPPWVHALGATRAIGGGVLLAWQQIDDTAFTIVRGAARPTVHTVATQPHYLIGVATVSDGYVLFWGGVAGPGIVSYQRLNPQLEPDGAVRQLHHAAVERLDVVGVGSAIYASYIRRADEGMSRVFIRHGESARRRRSARH